MSCVSTESGQLIDTCKGEAPATERVCPDNPDCRHQVPQSRSHVEHRSEAEVGGADGGGGGGGAGKGARRRRWRTGAWSTVRQCGQSTRGCRHNLQSGSSLLAVFSDLRGWPEAEGRGLPVRGWRRQLSVRRGPEAAGRDLLQHGALSSVELWTLGRGE